MGLLCKTVTLVSVSVSPLFARPNIIRYKADQTAKGDDSSCRPAPHALPDGMEMLFLLQSSLMMIEIRCEPESSSYLLL